MASKITVRFTEVGSDGAVLDLGNGMVYTFKYNPTRAREVGIGSTIDTLVKPETLAQNFKNAFEIADNFTNLFSVTYSATSLDENGVEQTPTGTLDGLVIIEHPENGYFDGVTENLGFIFLTIENTDPSTLPSLTVAIGASPTNVCSNVLITANTNVKGGRMTIEIPSGNIIDVVSIDTSGNFTYELDRVRPSSNTIGVVKVYETEFTTTVLKMYGFTVPGILTISEVQVLGSPYGAMATIIASGSNNEYSLDGTTWQSSSQFPNLLEGIYTAYVRDQYGCVKTLEFTVDANETAEITLPPYIHFPVHNSLRPVDRSGNIFTNFMAKETPGVTPIKSYFHEYIVGDSIRLQFRSTRPTHTAKMYDCKGNFTELLIEKLTNNISRVNIYEGNYKSIDGQVAVYFTSGNIFNPDGSLQDYGHDLNGLLPKWYQKDVFIHIEGLGTTKVERVYFDEEEEVIYALTEMTAETDGIGVKITSIHTENPYEVYEFGVNFNEEGEFIVEVDYGEPKTVWFEPVKVRQELHDRYLQVRWYSDENNEILYSSGIQQLRRIPWIKYFTYKSTVEKEIFRSDTTLRNVNSKSFATYEIAFRPMPMEVARGIDYGFQMAGGVVEINGALFVCDGELTVDPIGSLFKVTATLTLIGQSMTSPQYGVGDSFLIVDENVNGVAFLRIAQ